MTINDIQDFANSNYSYILIKTDINWADEANFPGFCIISKSNISKVIDNYTKYSRKRFLIHFGSNESNEYWNLDEILDSSTCSLINEKEFDILTELFSLYDEDTYLHYGKDYCSFLMDIEDE